MLEYFKPNITDRKSKIFFGIKIAVALFYTYFLVSFFVRKEYYNTMTIDDKEVTYLEPSRIVIILLVWVLGIFISIM